MFFTLEMQVKYDKYWNLNVVPKDEEIITSLQKKEMNVSHLIGEYCTHINNLINNLSRHNGPRADKYLRDTKMTALHDLEIYKRLVKYDAGNPKLVEFIEDNIKKINNAGKNVMLKHDFIQAGGKIKPIAPNEVSKEDEQGSWFENKM